MFRINERDQQRERAYPNCPMRFESSEPLAFLRNSAVPDFAIVPRLVASSDRVIPIPVSRVRSTVSATSGKVV